jgi:hypothetical protein
MAVRVGWRRCTSQIKLSVVASDIFGVSGRAMMAALVAGERDPKVLADMARGSMRGKTARLEEAFTGRFTDHHAFLLRTILARSDGIDTDIAIVQGHRLRERGDLLIDRPGCGDSLDVLPNRLGPRRPRAVEDRRRRGRPVQHRAGARGRRLTDQPGRQSASPTC